MTGSLAQIVTLTTFGNNFLYNGKTEENFIENLSFKFCNKIDFRIFEEPLFSKEQKETIVASDPNEWFQYLKKSGCKKLRLFFKNSADQSFAKDYKAAGLVGGGGTWFIEAIYDHYSNVWENRWEVTQEDDPNQNIWAVNYGQTYSKLPTLDLQIPLQKCKEELEEALSQIEVFAFGQNLEYWGKEFTEARKALEDGNPENLYYNTQLIPYDNFSLAAKQIICAAGIAWVFGAMGSWNDLGFNAKEDNEKYESLTETLYARVNEAIISATNSF